MSDVPPERIDALARQALDRPRDDRDAFLKRVCPNPDVREAVWERLDALDDAESPGDAPDDSPEASPSDEDDAAASVSPDAPTVADAPAEPPSSSEPEAPTERASPNPADHASPADASAPPSADSTPAESPSFRAAPDQVGPWEIVGLIGEGGMGTVHFAERADGQFEQQVALKLLRHDLDEAAQERFLAERQILAELQHPNIAHLLDGGVTAPESGSGQAGRPYFVMEYVDGTPLDTYCNDHQLGVEARLRLFRQVCEAVTFAHRNLIVHRDLKPSNILVTEPGADTATDDDTGTGPQVKLLDFGIAKALEGAEGRAARTQTGESPMTPRYAAPEQVQGDPITTATDVYSLGVVLYELLTGTLPYDIKNAPVAEVAEVISTTDPTAPSEQVTTTPSAASVVEQTHGMTPDELGRALNGDLDVIVKKALRKEPGQRYTSAAELGQDLDRYLDGLPVEARSASTGYRLRRFVARNRTAVLSGVAAMIALVVGLGVAVWQAQVAAAERDRAQAAQAEAEEAITFLTTLFEHAEPEEARGDTLTAYELVDQGRRRLSDLSDQPALQARMFDVVGEVYENLSEYKTADSLLHRSIRVQRSLSTPNRERLGEYLAERASVKMKLGQYRTADSLTQRALQAMRAGDAAGTVEYAEALSLRGNIALNQKRLRRADSLFERTESHYRSLLEETSEGTEEALDYSKSLASLRHNRASIHYYRNQFKKAEGLYRDALTKYRDIEGPNHPDVITIHSAIGLMLQEQGQLQAAAVHLDTAVTRGARVLGPRHAQMATYYSNLGDVRKAQGRYAVADSLYRRTLAIDKAQRGPRHPYVAGDWHLIGQTNRAWDRPERALEAFSKEVSLRRPAGVSVDLAKALHAQGTVLTDLGRYSTAEDRLLEARDVHTRVDEPDSSLTTDLHAALATLYTEWGRPGPAQRWQQRLDSLRTSASSKNTRPSSQSPN